MNDQTQSQWADLRMEWLWVYDGLVPKTEHWSKVIVVPQSVFFVLEGSGMIQTDGGRLVVPKGQGYMAAAGTRKQWFAKGTRLLSVGFRVTWPDGQPLVPAGLNCVLQPTVQKQLSKATRDLFRTIHGRRKRVTYDEASRVINHSFADWCSREAAFRQWFVEYVRTLERLNASPGPRKQAADHRLQEALRRLDAWPLSKPLVWAQLIREMNVGSRRIEQLFASELRLTPHAYFNRRRIETARHLLVNSVVPLKQISHEVGLRHASHFTKWFRRHTRVTPSEYRAQAMEVA